MNILYHHRTQGRGAEGVHITGIVRGFERRGHRVTLLSAPGVDPHKTAGTYLYSAAPSLMSRVWKSISRSCPQFVFELIEFAYNAFHLCRLWRVLRDEKIDLVYERYAFFLFATVALCRMKGIPVILEVNEIAGIPRARPLILRRAAQFIERTVFIKALSVVTVSSFIKRKIVEAGTPADQVVVMPNGVDPEMFNPRVDGSSVRKRFNMGDAVVIGFVGWIDPWDNLPGLLETFRDLLTAGANLKLFLIGDVAGKGVDKDLIAKTAAKLGVTHALIHVPRVPREDMPRHIAAMDVCVIPDSNEFGSPVVLFEFMGLAKAVVAPSVPPVLDVLRDGENGIVFEARNMAAMKAALSRAVGDKTLRDQISKSARRSIDEKHTWDNNAGSVLEIHKNAC